MPSLEQLSFGAMLRVVADALGGARDRAVVFGSSLGALTAARVAETDARVSALVLLAPAFRLAERWRSRLTAGFTSTSFASSPRSTPAAAAGPTSACRR